MKKTFSGKLATPLSTPSPHDPLARNQNRHRVETFLEDRAREERSKLDLLCEFYGIPKSPDAFAELSLALARQFVPGFRELKKRGRSSKWTELRKGAVVVEIERLIKRSGTRHSVLWAAKQLAKREPWKSFIEQKESGETNPDPAEVLRKVYQEFKDDIWADALRNHFKRCESDNDIARWETRVADFVRNRVSQ